MKFPDNFIYDGHHSATVYFARNKKLIFEQSVPILKDGLFPNIYVCGKETKLQLLSINFYVSWCSNQFSEKCFFFCLNFEVSTPRVEWISEVIYLISLHQQHKPNVLKYTWFYERGAQVSFLYNFFFHWTCLENACFHQSKAKMTIYNHGERKGEHSLVEEKVQIKIYYWYDWDLNSRPLILTTLPM